MEALKEFNFFTLGTWLNLPPDAKGSIITSLDVLDEADRLNLRNNVHLFDRFVIEAHKVVSTGRSRYSARTIVEYMRHHTEISDDSKTFKINSNLVPALSRASMAIFPSLNGLFETRG